MANIMMTPTMEMMKIKTPALVRFMYLATMTDVKTPTTAAAPGAMLSSVDCSLVKPNPAMIVGPGRISILRGYPRTAELTENGNTSRGQSQAQDNQEDNVESDIQERLAQLRSIEFPNLCACFVVPYALQSDDFLPLCQPPCIRGRGRQKEKHDHAKGNRQAAIEMYSARQ